jgi:hypothetical protein
MKKYSASLALLGAAFVYATGVLYFYRALEDSPYSFNLGIRYPAGIDPDWGNRLSVCWDLIVIAALITLLAVTTYFLVLSVPMIRHQDLGSRAFRPALPFAWFVLAL